MSGADSKNSDESASLAHAQTMDSGSRPQTADPVADSNADTAMATPDEQQRTKENSHPKGSSSPDELINTTLNERYEVTAKIGQGGMGAVYEAKHTVIGKRVAIKVLLDKHAEKDQVVARLKQEARLASSIGHANIIDITDFGVTVTGRTFVVMEYLEGESLGALINRDGSLGEQRVIHISSQIASALAAAHDKGIVHRDIKPENIFLQKRGNKDFVKVVDFGISKSMSPNDEDVRLTQTGMVLGTPLYMSPEQARGDEDLDHRVDVYAVGVIMYEAVTGRVPFQGKNYLNILTQVVADEPPKPSELVPAIDRDFESVILRAMAKDRDHRYETMEELASDLAALADPDTVTTGARITAAQWRRKQEKRPMRRYLPWIGATAIAAALSIVTITQLMGEDSKGTPKAAAAPPPADAAPPVDTPPDGAPEPAFKTASIRIVTNPPGATIYHGAIELCTPTPCTATPAMTGEAIQLRALLEGYEPGELPIVPELNDGKEIPVTLIKLPEPDDKGNGKRRPPRVKGKKGKGDSTAGSENDAKGGNNQGTGDLMGNPLRGGR